MHYKHNCKLHKEVNFLFWWRHHSELLISLDLMISHFRSLFKKTTQIALHYTVYAQAYNSTFQVALEFVPPNCFADSRLERKKGFLDLPCSSNCLGPISYCACQYIYMNRPIPFFRGTVKDQGGHQHFLTYYLIAIILGKE